MRLSVLLLVNMTLACATAKQIVHQELLPQNLSRFHAIAIKNDASALDISEPELRETVKESNESFAEVVGIRKWENDFTLIFVPKDSLDSFLAHYAPDLSWSRGYCSSDKKIAVITLSSDPHLTLSTLNHERAHCGLAGEVSELNALWLEYIVTLDQAMRINNYQWALELENIFRNKDGGVYVLARQYLWSWFDSYKKGYGEYPSQVSAVVGELLKVSAEKIKLKEYRLNYEEAWSAYKNFERERLLRMKDVYLPFCNNSSFCLYNILTAKDDELKEMEVKDAVSGTVSIWHQSTIAIRPFVDCWSHNLWPSFSYSQYLGDDSYQTTISMINTSDKTSSEVRCLIFEDSPFFEKREDYEDDHIQVVINHSLTYADKSFAVKNVPFEITSEYECFDRSDEPFKDDQKHLIHEFAFAVSDTTVVPTDCAAIPR